ncbi:MAG: peptidyl-prolyl cis-trans isomerase, partial [Gammaproteobacteria bacterium]|nr:peptidyl-prolyl cis-trans isomerase [Gammaproteobacteria bacterium]
LYRETLRQQMIMAQLASAYSSSNFITETEMQRVAELTAQTRDFRYLSVTLGTRTLGTAIGDVEIQAYYDTNSEDFAEEETVVVRYVTLDKDAIAEEIQVDEAELRALYESERDSFEGASEKRASHIMFEVGSDLSEDEALQLASAAQQRLVDGKDFGELALELSTDVLSAEQGGDIGYSDGGAFPAEIEEMLEVLNLNEVSGPVVTEFGVHLVKLTEDAENVFQSYEEVVERLERDLKSAEVELIYAERLEDLSNLAFETGELTTISEELNLTIEESDPTGRAGGRGIFTNQQVVAAAFADEVLLEGNNSDVLELNESQSVVLRVQEFNEANVRPLEEVEPEIAVLLRTIMERDAVQSLGEQLMLAAESGAGLDVLLQENELEWISQDAVERNATTVNRQILNEVFGMRRPENDSELASLTLDNGTFVLLELNQVNSGSVDSLDEEQRITLTNNLRVDLGNSDFEAYLNNLRSNADIQTTRAADQF